jgi:predicted metal-dependent peptidase
MSAYKKEDYTWARPNRRYWPDMYLPSMKSDSLDQISVGVDTSGSITQDHLNAFMAEVKYINDILKPKEIRIMTFDTRIRYDETFQEGDCIDDVKLLGGGGTDIHPLIRTLKEDGPEIAIIFTDLELSMPNLTNVPSDLFWIKIGNYDNPPNKGVVINYDD